ATNGDVARASGRFVIKMSTRWGGEVCKYVMRWDEIAWQDLRDFISPKMGEWSDLVVRHK
ncbi:hypothetical protein ACS0LF_004727, partial [Escherichia coli]